MSLFFLLHPKFGSGGGLPSFNEYANAEYARIVNNNALKRAEDIAKRNASKEEPRTVELQNEIQKFVGVSTKLDTDVGENERLRLLEIRAQLATRIIQMEEEEYFLMMILLQ